MYGVSTIKEVIEFIAGKRDLEPTVVNTREEFYARQLQFEADFSDVRGQENVKRALEVAAAGSHNLILIGPPGVASRCLARTSPFHLTALYLAGVIRDHQDTFGCR